MKKSTQTFLILLLLIHINLCRPYCQNDNDIYQKIKKVETRYIGEGSFGKIYGNQEEVSKTMATDDLISLQLLNNELKVMLAFRNEHDMMQLHADNCWYQKKNGINNYEVKIKMDLMDGDLKKAIVKSSLRTNIFWKIDILFKLATSLKKLHDQKILHLDLKEQNIMMMNEYNPVLADFGMAMLPNEQRNFIGGTPLFMSPEIKTRLYSVKGDVFALVYCAFDNLVNRMLSNNAYMRPTIDEVITTVLQKIKEIGNANLDNFKKYLDNEVQSYQGSDKSLTVQKHSAILIKKFKERTKIYGETLKGTDSQTLQQMVTAYCTSAKNPKIFIDKYSQKFALVGPSPQEIEQMDQSFYNEDMQRSKINLKNRMNIAEQSRIQVIDKKYMFNQEAIQDQEVNLPQINVKPKAVTNDIYGQLLKKQQQQNQQLQQHQIANRFNLSPGKNREQKFQLPQVNQGIYQQRFQSPQMNQGIHEQKIQMQNFHNQGQVQNLQLPAVQNKGISRFQIVNQQANKNQFHNPQNNLHVNQHQVQQQPIETRPGFNDFQRFKQRQNVDNVGALIGGGGFQNNNFQGGANNFRGRFII